MNNKINTIICILNSKFPFQIPHQKKLFIIIINASISLYICYPSYRYLRGYRIQAIRVIIRLDNVTQIDATQQLDKLKIAETIVAIISARIVVDFRVN